MSYTTVPYDDSMQLGEGYNSFLQEACIERAVVGAWRGSHRHRPAPTQVAQSVSYSSRFIEKVSEVARTMNISAGSSIKAGSIETGLNSMAIDELKFSTSDLNAVVSVKVVNKTTELLDQAAFAPIEREEGTQLKENFFETYGDTFISGFIEGGELHGIISIKILNASRKEEIETAIKGQFNGVASEFTLRNGSYWSNIESWLKETETTITVTWSGGGQIKPETEEWSIESLFKAAAAFPARVAACPQPTWAILTRYNKNRSALAYITKNNYKIPSFSKVQAYVSDLLDMYMEYKANIARIQDIMANLDPYQSRKSDGKQPKPGMIEPTVEALVKERADMKKEMAKISEVIDVLNLDPSMKHAVEIRSPEVWATKLPRIDTSAKGGIVADQQRFQDMLAGLPIVTSTPQKQNTGTDPAPKPTVPAQPTQPAAQPTTNPGTNPPKPTQPVPNPTATPAQNPAPSPTPNPAQNPVPKSGTTPAPVITPAQGTSSSTQQTASNQQSVVPNLTTKLCTPQTWATLNAAERDYINNPGDGLADPKYNFKYGRMTGNALTKTVFATPMNTIVSSGHQFMPVQDVIVIFNAEFESRMIKGMTFGTYEPMTYNWGDDYSSWTGRPQRFRVNSQIKETINGIDIGCRKDGTPGIDYVRFYTTGNRPIEECTFGYYSQDEVEKELNITKYVPDEGTKHLIGFWGWEANKLGVRFGPVWGNITKF